jgi:concanavalin A-like lectin/glucanase superfamily protein
MRRSLALGLFAVALIGGALWLRAGANRPAPPAAHESREPVAPRPEPAPPSSDDRRVAHADETTGDTAQPHRPRVRHKPHPTLGGLPGGSRPRPRRHGVLFESDPGMPYPTANASAVPVDGPFSARGGTVSFWLDPAWGAGNQDDATLLRLGNDLQIVKNVTFLRFEAVGPDGLGDGVGIPIGDWNPDEWHYITGTWDQGYLTLYVDGVMVSQKFVGATFDFGSQAMLTVGSTYPRTRPVAAGIIADVTVGSHPLSPAAVDHAFQRVTPPGS